MPASEKLISLENEHLAFSWFADASGELRDRSTQCVWRMAPFAIQERGGIVEEEVWHRASRTFGEEYVGRFRGERAGDAVRFTLLGRLGVEKGALTCRARLDGPWLEFRIEEIDEDLPSLIFPPPLEAEGLVLPRGIGRWVRKPLGERLFLTAFGDLSMRWFGGLRGDAGWLAVFSEGHADAGMHAVGLGAAPGWLKSHGQWRGPRAVRYRVTSGGYVGMARAFRDWAKEHQLHRSLKEKIAETPRLASLIGGRILSFHQSKPNRKNFHEEIFHPVAEKERAATGKVQVILSHAEAAQIVRDARALGMNRGLVNARGWIRGGYDDSHPDVWPPEKALGSMDELRALLTVEGLIGCLHDNYQDIYEHCPSFPHGVVRTSDGEPFAGGLWWGGQAYLICSREALAYARGNWEKIKELRPGGMFIDTTTASPLYECRDSGHAISRAEDERFKIELLDYYRKAGVVVGSEEGRDFGVPVTDFYENRHAHVPGESVPLWPLVYHDAIVCARYADQVPNPRGTPPILADLLWGYAPLWHVRDAKDWARRREDFRASLFADAWHARVGLDDLENHRYLTEDRLVEQTEFSSGVALVANFSNETREVAGVAVPAGRHAILE